MTRKQTAVEFAVDKLEKFIPSGNQIAIFSILQQAKQMEKDKIREAYYRGVKDEMQNIGKDFEDYYNETYGK